MNFNESDISFNDRVINKENEINPENESKNPYLKRDDVPKLK